ncbi:MAG: hypothetical protein ACR2JO_15315 [Mycobacteriales bacterium]
MDDVADELATTRVQVLALLRSGELSAIKIGGRGQWCVERCRFEEWIEQRYAETRRLVAERPRSDGDVAD